MSDSGIQLYQQIDSINSLLSITSEQEMSQKISQNIPKIFQIFNSFKNKLIYSQINSNDISQVTEALKFVDNLNLFMDEIDVRKFKDKMSEIREILKRRNYDFKETILKQINYTEMTIIYHKKLYFRNLYFNNHKGLSDEIENEIDQVYKNKFDFRLFKQMQNIFWVVKNVLDENKKIELDLRLKNMKTESQKIKEKKYGTNSYMPRGYMRNDNYMNDYNDYKGYSGYDYNDSFNRIDDNSYYGNKNYINKPYRGRGGYMGNSNRKYYPKKQEEKEIEIPSDPSYYSKNKDNEEININNNDINNNLNSENNNIDNLDNNINGGNDLLGNNNIINDINSNGGIRNDINIIQNNNNNINIDNENNGGNGEMLNININNDKEMNETNKNDDIEIISGNNNLSSYNRNKKKIYPNKMIAVELPSNEEINNNNNIINEENNNNGAKIENINNENNNIEINHNNNYNNNHNGDNNIQYNNDFRENKFKNNYYYNNGYKQNMYNKNNYRNNNYNRYNIRNNLSGNNYGDNNQNKKLLFVEIDVNNNPIENKVTNNEIINGQGNENNDNTIPEKNSNEPNGEVISSNNNIQENTNNKEENLNIINEKKEEVIESKPEQINEIKKEENIENANINIDNGEKKEINPEIAEQNTISNNNNIEIQKVEEINKIPENIQSNSDSDITAKISKSDSNINKMRPNIFNDNKNIEYNIQETDEENFHEAGNVMKGGDEILVEDEEIPDDAQLQYKIFAMEAGLPEPKGDFKLVTNKSRNSKDKEEKEENSNNDMDNNFGENDLMEYINSDIENEDITGLNDVEQEKVIKLKECLDKLNIPGIIKDALNELEEEERQLRLKILSKLDDNYKNEAINPKYTFYKNELFTQCSQIFSNELYDIIKEYKNNPAMQGMPLSKYIISRYINNHSHNKENDILREYIELKVKEIEHPEDIWNNMQRFEKMILIPLYQKTLKARKDKYNTLNEIYNLYEHAIKSIFKNSKDLDEVQKFGAFSNTFMIDYGEYDIDICLVPKCQLNYFRNTYTEKLIHGLKNCKLGNFKEVSTNENSNSFFVLKGDIIEKGQKININILIHNKIPIYHSHLLKTYALYDQRFHIMGIYLKYWAKINNLHGPNYLQSYALLFMIIHFLQKIVEPKVLPNLQKIPKFDNYKNTYEQGENIYEYYQDFESISTNLYYESNPKKIREYMSEINNNRNNDETVTNLLVKFFEYYSYCYDSNQKISVHKDLRESIKKGDDNIAYSIDDPFDIMNNPGKCLEKDSESCKKFVKAMKREINLILSGEYVKRFEYEKERIARISKK